MKRIELHMETEKSDGLSFLWTSTVIYECAQAGCQAVAVTDRNSVEAYWTMEEYAEKEGIRLIYGLTLDCVDQEDRYWVTLLAKNLEGRGNLFRLLELSQENGFSFGRCVTRAQLETHREGILVGASGINGEVVRGILYRKSTAYLERIAKTYDYLELPLEPYDVSSSLSQLAGRCQVPLCAVQNARMSRNADEITEHAYRAVAYHWGVEPDGEAFQGPEELWERFEDLYVLPAEREQIRQAFWEGPAAVLSQIEEMPTLHELIRESVAAHSGEDMAQLRELVGEKLRERYGAACPREVEERVQWELEKIEASNAARQFLLLYDVREILREMQGELWVQGPWGSSAVLYCLGVTEFDPMPRHGYCQECGTWLSLEREAETAVCPQCGKEMAVDGYDLSPVGLFLEKDVGLHEIEIRVSEKNNSQVRKRLINRYGDRHFLNVIHTVCGSRDIQEIKKVADQYLDKFVEAPLRSSLWQDIRFRVNLENWIIRNKCEEEYQHRIWWIPNQTIVQMLPVSKETDSCQIPQICIDYWQGVGPTLRILGMRDLDVLEQCQLVTGVNYREIPLNDSVVLKKICCGDQAFVERTPEMAVATLYGIPNNFIRRNGNLNAAEILRLLGNESIYKLVRVVTTECSQGLWENNEEKQIALGNLLPEEAITCREDVFRYLVAKGMEESVAVSVMTEIRTGGIDDEELSEDTWAALKACNVEPWFSKMCARIINLYSEVDGLFEAARWVRMMWYLHYYPDAVIGIIRKEEEMLDERNRVILQIEQECLGC